MTSFFRPFAVLFGLIAIAAAGPAHAADDKPTTAPSKAQDPALEDRAIRAKLDLMMPPVKFDAVGLSDVIDFVRDVNGANIFVNWKALEAAGVDRQSPVTLNLRNVKFAKALQLILECISSEKVKLAYTVDSGVISISTTGDLLGEPVSRTYDVRFLVPEALEAGAREKRVAALLKLVIGSIDPPSWGLHDGRARIAMEMKGELIVVQTEKNQEATAGLIKHLQGLLATAKP